MRLSIFNFDLAPLVKGLGTAAAAIALASVILPRHLPYDEFGAPGAETLNELVLEQFTYQYPEKPIVLLGSSILTMIPPANCRPDNVGSIYLQGRSAMTGMEMLQRLRAHPKVVFVEVPTLLIGVDTNLIDTVFTPVYWRIRSAIPALRWNRNWLVLLYRREIYQRLPPKFTLKLPAESVTEWDAERAAFIEPQLRPYNNDSNIDQIIPQVIDRVRGLQHSGTRVIFFDPIDARMRAQPQESHLREKLRDALPNVEMIEAPDGEAPLYRWDGMHFVDASGLWFFNFLMNRAGIPFTPKCELYSDKS
jgi:hypothetical protein